MNAIPMILHCPECRGRHIDEGEFATKEHHTHACQHCGFVWRPAVVATVGVQFLPGFRNPQPKVYAFKPSHLAIDKQTFEDLLVGKHLAKPRKRR